MKHNPETGNRQPTTGILLIALGSPQYGSYAVNLAASIRWNDPTLPIHLVHTSESIAHFAPEHLALFTSREICPAEAYTKMQVVENVSPGNSQPATNNRIEYIRAKTYMYDLSPFDETLFLDVDTMILPHNRMSDFINKLSTECDFTIENRGYADLAADKSLKDYSIWCNVDELKAYYTTASRKMKGEMRYYNLHSELVFFKKDKKNKTFFDKVKEVYDNPPVSTTKFDTGLPDEFAFGVAMMLLKHYPHQENYVRIYWNFMEQKHDWYKHVIKNFIGFSLGGNTISPTILMRVKAYNNLFRQKLRLPYLFTPHHKKQWNKHRVRG
jgi:hypothetical protein